jgi:dipeptidyl aminopeptidase/acylaminoacyl peptidase
MSSPRLLGLILGAALLVAALPSAAAPPKTPTIRQSIDMVAVNAPKISPDGRRVVYEQARTNWDANAFETDLWIADVATGERHLLTTASKSSTEAAWSPDGRWIAFISDRPGVLPKSPPDKRQVYVLPASGGEAQQITKAEKGVNAFEWSPDSRRIAFTAEGPEPKALKDRKETFGDYRVIRADYGMVQLWLQDLPTMDPAGRLAPPAEPKALTKADAFSVLTGFSFSPDGTRVAFAAQRDPDLISSHTSQIHVVTVADAKVSLLVGGAGPNSDPRWSPDGLQIAFETSGGDEFFFYANQKIAVVPAAGGASRIANPGFDEDADLLRWGPDGLYFGGRARTESGLWRLDPKSGAATRLAFPGLPMGQRFSLSADSKRAAFQGAAANRYPEIYAADLAGSAPVKLTDAGSQTQPFDTGKRELVTWKSKDGTPIEGVLLTPPGFDPSKKYPLLVVIHGGPTGIDVPWVTADRIYPTERFLAKGAVILRPNYRGSAGYGGKFRALNVRNLGVGDYADVISGVDALIAKGFVDKDRVAAMGWSQGGYISAFITTSSDRFKAVSVGAGISDWMTYYANTDITPFTRQYLKGTPWDDPEIYRKTSPISYVAKAKTPTLIQHGSNDRRVPIANAYELRQALEDKNVPVKMVVYEGFGHGINKPRQHRALMEENEAWFSHYIWGEPLPMALRPDTPDLKVEESSAKPPEPTAARPAANED